MSRRHAFELLLPDTHRVGGWEADRHEVITSSVVPSAGNVERARSARSVGVDCYRRPDNRWATDLWWTLEQPDATTHVARVTLVGLHAVEATSADNIDARLEDAAFALLCAVRRLTAGQAAESPRDWPDGLWDEALAESFRVLARQEWWSLPALQEVVGDTTAVLARHHRPGFVIHAQPIEPSVGLEGSVSVTFVADERRAGGTLTVEATGGGVASTPTALVHVAASLWAEVVPVTPTPQQRRVRGPARAEDVTVSFIVPARSWWMVLERAGRRAGRAPG